jgi:hypothetical protein
LVLESRPTTLIDRIAVEIKFHNVIKRHEFRAARPRHEESVRAFGMPKAQMSESVHNPFMGQDSVSGYEVLEMNVQPRHWLHSVLVQICWKERDLNGQNLTPKIS